MLPTWERLRQRWLLWLILGISGGTAIVSTLNHQGMLKVESVAGRGVPKPPDENQIGKLFRAAHHADWLGETLTNPYGSERIIYARFKKVIAVWIKRLPDSADIDDMYLLASSDSSDFKTNPWNRHVKVELPQDYYYDEKVVARYILENRNDADDSKDKLVPLGPIAYWCKHDKEDCMDLLGTRVFQFEFIKSRVWVQKFQRGIIVGPLPVWQYNDKDHQYYGKSDVLTIPTDQDSHVRYKSYISDFPLPTPSPNESSPRCYECRN